MPDTKPNWTRTILHFESSVTDAIKSLNDSMMQIVLVVDDDNRLLGTITDGDIRRSMLSGVGLSAPIDAIVNLSPLVVSTDMTNDSILELMKMNKIRQLPVVDANRHVTDLRIWDALLVPKCRDNLVVIMAGGKGKRLRPHTENCPKPLLSVGGKPMLERILLRAKQDGFHNFKLAIHYLGHMIEDYFGSGEKWDVNIEYIREESPLGTAGALSLLDVQADLPILITNGDVLTDIKYGDIVDFHSSHNAQATMAVRQHQWAHPFGVVKTDGINIIGFDEKPIINSHINAGIYVLETGAIGKLIPKEYCDMPTLFDRLNESSGRTIVYPMHEPWLDVGRHDDFNLAQQAHSSEG